MAKISNICRLAIPFGSALARLSSDCAPLREALKGAKKARESGSSAGDFALSDAPLTLGAVAAGSRAMPVALTWGSTVGRAMAENFGVEIVDWNLKPEEMFVFQVWGAHPAEEPSVFGRECFDAASKLGLFDVAHQALNAIDVRCIRRPLVAASSIYAWFGQALHGRSDLESVQALLGVSPFAIAQLQGKYCGLDVRPPSGVYAGSFAEEYANGLGTLISATSREGAVDFINLYLVQLATHGANFGELAAFRRQQGESQFNPIGSIMAGFEHLSADAHGGAQSLVLEMMFDAMRYCTEHGRSRDSLLEWARGRKGLFMGLGHAKYREPDPRGVVLSNHARTVKIVAEDQRFTFFEFFLEHIGSILAEVRPSITNKNPNVDFWAALLQFMFLGITNPEALELLFGLARVPAYIKAALICKTLGVAIERPDEVVLDRMIELTGATHPFSDTALFQ